MHATDPFVRWLRGASPYIDAHRGRTFVVLLPQAAVNGEHALNIAHDLALLHSLGVRLVLVCAADALLADCPRNGGAPVIDEHRLRALLGPLAGLRTRVETLLGTGLPGAQASWQGATVVGGNLVTARPLGIVDGIDHGAAGSVRRINTGAIRAALDGGAIVCLGPLAGSPSGQQFVIDGGELAGLAAARLGADKLIWLADQPALLNPAGQRISELTPGALDASVDSHPAQLAGALHALSRAARAGVPRCHLVGHDDDGALLKELFTHEGCGTQITETSYEQIPDDVAGIVELIRPLEASGALVPRSRAELERDIGDFSVVDLDGLIIGCAALQPLSATCMELACFATHPDYRQHRPGAGRSTLGELLLDTIEHRARAAGATELVALTTRTEHWFAEHGFARASTADLPAERRARYDAARAPLVLRKAL